jgi:3-hydroxyisobutyrate dehydrogenase-like beta-hydroxyacid dehydrogenase
MKVGIVGTGRMGRNLAERMSTRHEVVLYDSEPAAARAVADSLQVRSAGSLAEMDVAAFVLAVPDSAVKACVDRLVELQTPTLILSVATNISREILREIAGDKANCLNVKIIGHAGEMSRGAQPVIVIDQGRPDQVEIAWQLFEPVGNVVVGEADLVKTINVIATQQALKAAVEIERQLERAGVTDPVLVQGALIQVAPGVFKAFAENDLGPFGRGLVAQLRENPDS